MLSEKEASEIVLIVHGTWANPKDGEASDQDEGPWWKSYGPFAKKLEAALGRHGSSARCDLSVSILTSLERFREIGLWWHGWSGDNSEVERRRAAYELARQIRALQEESKIEAIHIVAHSHGGNVARRALRYLNRPKSKLGAVVCLGTPFLHFRDRAFWRRWLSRVHWPMLFVVLGLVAVMLLKASTLSESGNELVAVMGALLVGAGLHTVWRYARSSEASSVAVPMVALQFADDEAIQLLRSCAVLTADPHLFLLDVLGGAAESRPWVPRERGGRRGVGRALDGLAAGWRGLKNALVVLSNAWNGPARRVAERLTSWAYHLPLLGHLGTLLLIMAFRPYRPKVRPFLSSRMPRLKKLFFHSMEEEYEASMRAAQETYTPPLPGRPSFGLESSLTRIHEPRERWWSRLPNALENSFLDPNSWRNMVAGAAALLYLLLVPIDFVLGLPAWLGAVLTRLAILVGARAGAASAPGMDMLGAAFQASRTGTLPEEVRPIAVPPAIEADIARGLASEGRIDLASLRASLDPSRRATLLKSIDAAFTDVGLLHAQYYQDDRVIDYVAQRIAHKNSPEWVEDSAKLAVPQKES